MSGTQYRRPPSRRGVAYVPVYTLHEMREELRNMGNTEQIPQVPVIICSGCGHEITAPKGSAAIQCRDCGKKMQVVSVGPALQSSQANPEKE